MGRGDLCLIRVVGSLNNGLIGSPILGDVGVNYRLLNRGGEVFCLIITLLRGVVNLRVYETKICTFTNR